MNLIDKIKQIKLLKLPNEAVSIGSFEQSAEQNKLWEKKKKICKTNAILRQEKVSGNEIKHYLTWYDTTELFREIVLWIGITKEDIDNETSTFMVYADEFYHSRLG